MNTKKVVDGREVQCFSSAFYLNRAKPGCVNPATLVVGQDVYMFSSGIYLNQGKVVAVTPSSTEVRTIDGELLRFDIYGRETDASRRDRLGFGPSPDSKFHTSLWNSAPEFQPW